MQIKNDHYNTRHYPFRKFEHQQETETSFFHTENYDFWGINEEFSNHIRTKEFKTKATTFVSTIVGTVLPIIFFKKSQDKSFGKDFFKGPLKTKLKNVLELLHIKYGLKEMITIALGSIAGGLAGGMIADKKVNKPDKIDEAIFQSLNIVIPTSLMAGLFKLTEKNKNIFLKMAITAASLVAGTKAALIISNEIDDRLDRVPDGQRKLKVVDTLVHVDDLASALVLAKVPIVQKLHFDKILPFFYGLCGYRTGTKN